LKLPLSDILGVNDLIGDNDLFGLGGLDGVCGLMGVVGLETLSVSGFLVLIHAGNLLSISNGKSAASLAIIFPVP
jgi:hypothetical protein